MSRKGMRWTLGVVVGSLALKDVGVSAVHYRHVGFGHRDRLLLQGGLQGDPLPRVVDVQKAAFDENYRLQRFTPRRSGSRWPKIYGDRVTEFIE